MLVTFEEYGRLGFNNAQEADFNRFLASAEAAVNRYTFSRVTGENISEAGKYGVCELIDIFHRDAANNGVSSFSNEGYSETFAGSATMERVSDVIGLYFGNGDRFRGVV